MPVMKLLLLLSVVIFRLSCACVAMKPKDFDDVMPLRRDPPPNHQSTADSMQTTSSNGQTTSENTVAAMETTSVSSVSTTTSVASTSTSTTSTTTTTTTQDPCDMCMIPTEIPVTDDGAPCFATDPTLPSIMISALPNGMNCELVVSGCLTYEIANSGGNCDLGSLSPNIICQNGIFESPTFPGEAITRIRCSSR